MSEGLAVEIQILVIVGIAGLVILIIFFQRQTQLWAWNDLAVRTGLVCDSGKYLWSPIRVTGLYRGHSLILDTFTRGSGKNSRTYTRAVLSVNNPVPLQLVLSEEKVFDKMGKWMGVQDIQVGDETLDRRYKIKGQPEAEIVRLLASWEVRRKLLEVSSLKIEIEAGEVRAEKHGTEKKVEELEKAFELLSGIAEEVERISNTSYGGSV